MAHTTCGSEKTDGEESTRERGLGVGLGRDSRYGSIYVCPPPPRDPRALVLPPSSLPDFFKRLKIKIRKKDAHRWKGLSKLS